MEQVAKYRGELEWGEIPMAGKTVEAASLLPEGFRPGNVAAVIVRHGARSYAVTLNARVPATAEIVLDGSGQVCGIPAVAGGSVQEARAVEPSARCRRKGEALFASGAVREIGNGAYAVITERVHVVCSGRCDCLGFRFRKHCSHAIAVEAFLSGNVGGSA